MIFFRTDLPALVGNFSFKVLSITQVDNQAQFHNDSRCKICQNFVHSIF